MAISWGGFAKHMRVGIEVWTDNYNTWTPSINVYVAYYVQCDSTWNFDDDESLVLGGNAGGAYNFHNGLRANQSQHLGTYTVAGQGQNYGGGPTYTFNGTLTGIYPGAGGGADPSHSVQFTLPPRPIRPPAPPGTPVASNLQATTTTLSWPGSPDHGGSSPDADTLHLATDPNFANIIQDLYGPGSSRNVTGLAPGTTYWARSFVHNAAGWSGASPTMSFTTTSFQTAKPTVTGLNPDKLTLNWTAPSGGTATGYQIQRATDSGFTANVVTITSASWATSRAITGLQPATTYYFRVRANTSSGYGAWSPAVSAETLSGAKVRSGGAWVNGVAYVREAGTWKLAKVYKRAGGAWVL